MFRPSRCCATVLVAVFLSLGVARAASPAWSIGTVDSTGSTGWSSSLAFDPTDGNPSIAFVDISRNQVKFSDWNGSRWVTETVASGAAPDLGYDFAGRPCLSMRYGSKGDIRFARREGNGWIFQYVDSGHFGNATSLAFDAAGNPAIGYAVTNRKAVDLKLARWNGISWSTQVVEAGARAAWLSMAFSGLGLPAIAYSADANGDLKIDTLKFASWNGSAWIPEVVDRATSGGGLAASVSLGYDPATGNPAVAYTSGDAPKGPRFARKTGSGWVIETVEAIDFGFDTSLVFNGAGRAYVFYVDGKSPADDVKLAWRDAGVWNREVIDSVTYAYGGPTCLALGPGGAPAVSFRVSSTNTLIHAARTGAP